MYAYLNLILDKTNGKYIDITNDFKRFSQLHSWYKHLSDCDIFYILLLPGEEWRYDFDKRLSDPEQTNFHWHFFQKNEYDWLEKNPGKYNSVLNKELLILAKKFPTYYNHQLYEFNLNYPKTDLSKYQLGIAKKASQNYWQAILNYRLKYNLALFIYGFYDTNSLISLLPTEIIEMICKIVIE